MKVSVIGGGAIGLLVSYFLKMNRAEPVVYTRTKEQSQKLNQTGITYININGTKESISVQALPVEEFSGIEKYCVIAVKQTSMQELAFLKKQENRNTSCLFLQNGISHIKFLDDLPQKEIAVGVVEHGAVKENYTTVSHLGAGRIKISSYRGEELSDWREIFRDERFPVIKENCWEKMLFEKLIMNACINPVTALLRIPNGALVENKHALSIMKKLFIETVSVLNMENRQEELWKELLTLCRNTSLNRSSMLKSVESGQQTEIDSITGEIIERARSKNIHIAYSEFVYKAVKALDWRG